LLLVESLFEVLSFDSLEGAVLGLVELDDDDAEGEDDEEEAGGVGALELELEDDGLLESARGDTGVELDGLVDDADDEDGLPASRLSQP